MPVTTLTVSTGPLTAAGTTPLPFDFDAQSADEIEVTLDGIIVSPSLYSVELNGDNTGEVTPLTTFGTGEVYINSKPDFDQAANWERYAPFFPDQIVPPLDRIARQLLFLKSKIDGGIVDLPAAAKAGYYSAWDADGLPVAASGTGADAGLRTDLAASPGSSLVANLLGFTGAVARSIGDWLSDQPSVMDFIPFVERVKIRTGLTSATSHTPYIQAALNAQKSLYVPDGRYSLQTPLASTAASLGMHGTGGAHFVCSGENANANCLSITHDGFVVKGIEFTPGTVVTGLDQGWGIIVTGHRPLVENCRFSGHRRGGVGLFDVNDAIVRANTFADSPVTQNPVSPIPQSQMGFDIYGSGTTSRARITDNICASGCGVGIGFQTTGLSTGGVGNTVIGNTMRGHPCYGFMAYGSDGEPIIDLTFVANLIEDISGVVALPGDPTHRFYGAGAYIASAKGLICEINTIKRTNTDVLYPRTGSDVPAAIAISGWSTGTVRGNRIDGAFHGIMVVATSAPEFTTDGLVISDNVGRNIGYAGDATSGVGIYLLDARNATAHGNRMRGIGQGRGIMVQRATVTMDDFLLHGNDLANFNNGIESLGTISYIDASDNNVKSLGTHGLYLTATTVKIDGNRATAPTGITMTGAVTAGVMGANIINATGVAIDNGGAAAILPTNIIIAGTLSGYPSVLADSATPTIGHRRHVSFAFTTTLTNFLGLKEGQIWTLNAEASFSITHSANIILRGAVDRAMTAGQSIQFVYSNGRSREI